jgi:hypothetical protein
LPHKLAHDILQKMLKLVALVALITFAAADMSAEEREEFAAMKAKFATLEAKLDATHVLPAGALLTFADGRTVCPEGTIEPAHLKGRMMTTIPINGTSGAVFNRPFDAGEVGRTPAHSHAVSVNDPGHNHVNVVNDPGHGHTISDLGDNHMGPGPRGTYNQGAANPEFVTDNATTGIVVDNLPAKSSIEVSIDANDAGEHYPLVYVLLCQKLP